MLNPFFQKINNKPIHVITFVAVVTFFWSLFIPKLEIDFSIEHLFSQSDPNVEKYFSFRNTFGREDNMMTIIYEPDDYLNKAVYSELENLLYDIKDLNGIKNVISIFSLSDLDTRAWIGNVNDDSIIWNRDTVLKKLKYIQSDPSIGTRVLSSNLKFGAMIISLNDEINNHKDRTELLEKIKSITKNTSVKWIYSGVSVLRSEYVKYMLRDNFIFLPPIAILLISILRFIFRNWLLVILPIITVLVSVVWLLGIMGMMGLEINIMTYIVPTLLFIIGISDAIHIQSRFIENLSRNPSDYEGAVFLTMAQMSKVIFLTSLTTSIGFLALTTTSIKIVQEFGIEIAIGVIIAWLVSILVVPSGILIFKNFGQQKEDQFSIILKWLSNTIPRKTWIFITIPLFISFVAIYKIKDISTDASLLDDLRPKNKLYHDLKLTEKYFGGVLPFEVLIKIKQNNDTEDIALIDEDILELVDRVEEQLKLHFKESRFFSINTLLQSFKRIRGEKDSIFSLQEIIDKIVDNQKSQGIKLISDDKKILRITGLIENKTSSNMDKIYVKLDSLAETFPDYISIEYTGTTVVALKTNDYLVNSLVNSLGIALLFISIIMAVLFRENSILFASLITNLVPICTVLGIISWLGISIRPPTAMTFSVALGIAVDDSLHFLLRFRKELKKGLNRVEAIQSTIINTGSALMVTTTVLVSGFSVLLLSSFLPTYQFGLLSATMIGVALLCDITLLPALCLVLPNQNQNR
tara:strand:- start:58999 stop:61245 length:2247 start_codon:yes stop_codon:yes gene_type:complete